MRCTGHCCLEFPLSETLEKLREMDRAGHSEAGKVLAMVVPVSPDTYTCRHLRSNGDCGIYAERPRMCSNYPYDRPCQHQGCTLTKEEE